MVVLQNSGRKHGFFKSVVVRKAAKIIREVPVNLTMQIRAGKSPEGDVSVSVHIDLVNVSIGTYLPCWRR
jgi:hypothetical protein